MALRVIPLFLIMHDGKININYLIKDNFNILFFLSFFSISTFS